MACSILRNMNKMNFHQRDRKSGFGIVWVYSRPLSVRKRANEYSNTILDRDALFRLARLYLVHIIAVYSNFGKSEGFLRDYKNIML